MGDAPLRFGVRDGLVNQVKSWNRQGEAFSFVERALDDVHRS
jgi:hypothetical protein